MLKVSKLVLYALRIHGYIPDNPGRRLDSFILALPRYSARTGPFITLFSQ